MADRCKIGLTAVKALSPNSELWDDGVTGFGIRRQRSTSVAYVVLYRTPEGRSRRVTIGRHGAPWTPDDARAEAKRILGAVVTGADPAGAKKAWRQAPTVAELCDAYLAAADKGTLLTRRGRAKKPSTLATDKSRIDAHIRPLLGTLKAAAVTSRDVRDFMASVQKGKTAKRTKMDKRYALSIVRGGDGAAARTVGLLGAIFTYAVAEGIRGDNPVRGVTRPADKTRSRRLTDEEYQGFGAGLAKMATLVPGVGEKPARAPMWGHAVAAARFLALTGWRMGEAIGLRWEAVDLATRTARLSDTKTGESIRPLAHAACDLLAEQRSATGGAGLVFPSSRGEGTMAGFGAMFARVVHAGGVPADVTPHVLRHSYASLAADLGYSDTAIGACIGHRGGGVTRRYIHHADAVLLATADAIAMETLRRMGEATQSAKVVELEARRSRKAKTA